MEVQNGKIYTIRSYNSDKYYIGSTNHVTLAQRLGKHRANYKHYLNDNLNKYMSSYEILKYEDHYIELLELYPCNSKDELRRREGQLQRHFKHEIVNINIAGRLVSEYRAEHIEEVSEYHKQYNLVNKEIIAEKNKQHYETNKQSILERQKKRYDNNKEIILEKAKKTYLCNCGKTLIISEKSRHIKKPKHIYIIAQQQQFINELSYYNL